MSYAVGVFNIPRQQGNFSLDVSYRASFVFEQRSHSIANLHVHSDIDVRSLQEIAVEQQAMVWKTLRYYILMIWTHCNGYRFKKWNEFESSTRLIMFHFMLIPWGKNINPAPLIPSFMVIF